VYVTATLPYILIFAFLIRAVTLDGSYDGIKRYILPEWGQLITFEVCAVYCPHSLAQNKGPLEVGVLNILFIPLPRFFLN